MTALPSARAATASRPSPSVLGQAGIANALAIGLLLSACDTTHEMADNPTPLYQTDSGKLLTAEQVESYQYYPQPDFDGERVYRVKDQNGCDWWITSGMKFDREYVVLDDGGKPICPQSAPVPEPETGYREIKK